MGQASCCWTTCKLRLLRNSKEHLDGQSASGSHLFKLASCLCKTTANCQCCQRTGMATRGVAWELSESHYLLLYLVVTRLQTGSQCSVFISYHIFSYKDSWLSCPLAVNVLFLIMHIYHFAAFIAKLNRKLADFTTLLFLYIGWCTDLLIPGGIKNLLTD